MDWKVEFDKKFGKITKYLNDNPGLPLSDIHAGCDDCAINQRIRQEHKDFIENLLEQEKKRMSDEIEKIEVMQSEEEIIDIVLSIISKK